MATILLAEDQSQVRSALRFIIEQKLGWQVCGEAADVYALLASVRENKPDLVLIDAELPGLTSRRTSLPTSYNAKELIRQLDYLSPDTRIVALSTLPEARSAMLSAGVHAFISKNDPPEILLQTIQSLWNFRSSIKTVKSLFSY